MKVLIENVGNIIRFEAEITDIMVFIGPDMVSIDSICKRVRCSSSKVWSMFEQPERGLFPLKQNEQVTGIARHMNRNPDHQFFITTHSPYILTALNNKIYAFQVGQTRPDEVSTLVPRDEWIDPQRVSAYYVENGEVSSIMDEELRHIDANRIDAASDMTNALHGELLDIKFKEEGND